MASPKPKIWDVLRKKPAESLARLSARLKRSKSYKHNTDARDVLSADASLQSVHHTQAAGYIEKSRSELGKTNDVEMGMSGSPVAGRGAGSTSRKPPEPRRPTEENDNDPFDFEDSSKPTTVVYSFSRSVSLRSASIRSGSDGVGGGKGELDDGRSWEESGTPGTREGGGEGSKERLRWCTEALKRLQEKISELEGISSDSGRPGFDELFDWMKAEAVKGTERSTKSALLRINRNKNRYSDVLPYEESRVVLNGPKRSPADGSDYINASHISDPGDESLPQFIAAQGPLDSTAADFWEMAVQQRCTAVVMLSREVESNRVKCARYFPLEEGSGQHYGCMRVSNVRTEGLDEHAGGGSTVMRTLIVENTKETESSPHELEHFLYRDWPDHGVPKDTKSIRHVIRHLRDAPSPISTGPFIIHCSAGIGRTGTYCTIDYTLRKLLHGDMTALDIASTVKLFRSQRAGMVQTKDQFRFCFYAVRDELIDILASRAE